MVVTQPEQHLHRNTEMSHRDFNRIYIEMQDRVYRLAAGLTGNRDEAEDVVQDLYEKLWRRRTTVEGMDNPAGYILTSARNLCLDRLRGRRSRAELSPTIAARGAEPDQGDIADIVATLVAALPERQRTVITLRDVECLEMDEIAAITGMRQTAARMALSRARMTVKEKLEKIMNYGT